MSQHERFIYSRNAYSEANAVVVVLSICCSNCTIKLVQHLIMSVWANVTLSFNGTLPILVLSGTIVSNTGWSKYWHASVLHFTGAFLILEVQVTWNWHSNETKVLSQTTYLVPGTYFLSSRHYSAIELSGARLTSFLFCV